MKEPFRWWLGVLVAQACAGMIALAMTFGPRRAGSGSGPGLPALLVDDPDPLLQLLIWFGLVNLAIAAGALLVWLWVRLRPG